MSFWSAKNRKNRRNWLDAECVNSCCWRNREEWDNNNWLIELKRSDENDYKIQF
jgi:hypothetical protein